MTEVKEDSEQKHQQLNSKQHRAGQRWVVGKQRIRPKEGYKEMKDTKPPVGWNLIDFDQTPVSVAVGNEEDWENLEGDDPNGDDGSDARSISGSESEGGGNDDFHHEQMQSDLSHRSAMISLKMENAYLVRELELGDLKLQNMKDRTEEILQTTKKKKSELKQLQFQRRQRERQKLRSERGELARIEASVGEFWRNCVRGREEGGVGGEEGKMEEKMEEIFCDSLIQIKME